MVYRCSVCDYLYTPEMEKTLLFEKLPSDWKCPQCGAGKSVFVKIITIDKK